MPEDFEAPLLELQKKIEALAAFPGDPAKEAEANRLRQELHAKRKEIYAKLTPWQKTQVARHPQRPHCLDYVHQLITDFAPLASDSTFGEDEAIVGGFGRFKG